MGKPRSRMSGAVSEQLEIAPLYYAFGKTLHFFKLWTRLKKKEINAHRFKLGDAFRNLIGRTH